MINAKDKLLNLFPLPFVVLFLLSFGVVLYRNETVVVRKATNSQKIISARKVGEVVDRASQEM
jgi:hypothetical protein